MTPKWSQISALATRIPRFQLGRTKVHLRGDLCLPPSFLAPCLTSTYSTSSRARKNRRKPKRHGWQDPYLLRLTVARREANLARRGVLQEERAKTMGDPIRGIDTPFVKSFDYGISRGLSNEKGAPETTSATDVASSSDQAPTSSSEKEDLNYGLSHDQVRQSLAASRFLTQPLSPEEHSEMNIPGAPMSNRVEKELEAWQKRDRNATDAVQRIVSLANGSSVQRTQRNIARVIDAFGRHNTDTLLKPKARAVSLSTAASGTPLPTPTALKQRAGPDTGSSEVQVGILTAKIRVLADRYEGENRNDKINKRNLRLLLHRRQKLLKYMEKKERGSERWTHMLEKLGLTKATWKGEISVQ